MVQADPQAAGPGGVHQFANEVAAGGGLGGVEVAQGGVVEPEPVVVHGGEDDVAHPGADRQVAERGGIEVLGGETVGELPVLVDRNLLAVQDPFRPLEQAVEPVVNEHAVARVNELFAGCHASSWRPGRPGPALRVPFSQNRASESRAPERHGMGALECWKDGMLGASSRNCLRGGVMGRASS